MRFVRLLLKICVFLPYSVYSQTAQCNATDYFCKHCMEFGTTSSQVTAFHANNTCHMAFDVNDNNTIENVGPRCEQVWANKSYNSYCQLSALPDPQLVETYLTQRIRNTSRRMFIALFRNNCTTTWNWKARDGTLTFAAERPNLDCNLTTGVLEGTQILEINPKTYVTNAFTCQCVAKNGSTLLPGAKDNASPPSSYMLMHLLLLTSSYIFL